MSDATGALVGIDALVDDFVARRRLADCLEPAADLLWAPQFAAPRIDKGPCLVRNARPVLTGPHAGVEISCACFGR